MVTASVDLDLSKTSLKVQIVQVYMKTDSINTEQIMTDKPKPYSACTYHLKVILLWSGIIAPVRCSWMQWPYFKYGEGAWKWKKNIINNLRVWINMSNVDYIICKPHAQSIWSHRHFIFFFLDNYLSLAFHSFAILLITIKLVRLMHISLDLQCKCAIIGRQPLDASNSTVDCWCALIISTNAFDFLETCDCY